MLGLRFQELSWDHTYPDEEEEHILWLEFDGENEGTLVNKLLKIYSKQVTGISGVFLVSGPHPASGRLTEAASKRQGV